MTKLFEKFGADESGAITVDWVVLTAAIVGLTIAVMASTSDGLQNLSGDIENQLTSQDVSPAF